MPLCTFSRRRIFVSPSVRTAALLAAAFGVSNAWAQETVVVTTTSRQSGSAARRPLSSLGQALQPATFYWNARETGVLLSIDISSDAEPERLLPRSSFDGVQYNQPPQTNNENRLTDIAERFKRRVVSAGSVTVLAPALTTVLASRLPKPDLYADLSVGEKLRRLQSTLTPAQWRLLASPGGLGQGDLKGAQKPLFASMLPEPLYLTRVHNENGKSSSFYESSPAPVVLSAAQQAGVRLTVYRTLSWWFSKTDPGSNQTGSVGIGINSATGPDGTDTYTLRDKETMGWGAPETTIFGATVKSVVPSRVKPTDLDYASMALTAAVSLENAKTVGELVGRVQKATGVPIFCDPRYRDLTFTMRAEENQSVRSGDLLKALAVGVCGTFRRVADKEKAAYILTDDLEGLGTRQARIAEWAQDAAAQRQTTDAEVDRALRNVNIGDHVGWRTDDPMTPGGDLAQRIEDYRAGKDPAGAAQSNVKGQESGLWVPVSDLPPLAQNAVKQQIESWNKGIEEEQKRNDDGYRFHSGLLRTDRVHLNVQTGLAFLVPGVGQVSAGSLDSYNRSQDLLARPFKMPTPAVPNDTRNRPGGMAQPETFHWPQPGGTVRALLIPLPETAQAATEAATAAKSHGFNQLWVELPLGDSNKERLAVTISAASASGLRVQAVVHPTRRPVGDAAPLARDKNMLGETISMWATRRAASIAAQAEPTTENTAYLPEDFERRQMAQARDGERRAAARQKAWGDFLDIGDADVQASVVSEINALMQTPQLGGVVVRGLAAPGSAGSETFNYNYRLRSVVEDFGYTPAQRLRFVQQNGIDPVDLSPLAQGQLNLPYGMMGRFGPPPSINLPQMPDYGSNAQNTTINGVSASNLGAKNGWSLWKTNRGETANSFWGRVRSGVDAKAANGSLLREPDEPSGNGSSGAARVTLIGSQDKPAPSSVPASGESKKPATAAPTTMDAWVTAEREKQYQRSSLVYLSFHYDPSEKAVNAYFGSAEPAVKKDPARQFYDTFRSYLRAYQSGWDGVVVDLSALSMEVALPLLRDLPDEPIVPVGNEKLSAKPLPK